MLKNHVNYTEFFRDEKDIYVQNVSNCQVSVMFEVGQSCQSYLFPNNKDPVCLSRYVPFSAIKSSMDLRKMLNRQPQTLRLMTEEEYVGYFEKKAQIQGLASPDVAEQQAEAKRTSIQNYMPLPDAPEPVKLHDVVEDGQRLGEHKVVKTIQIVSEEDEINGKVINLCLQVHNSIPEQQKMSASQMLSEIEDMSDQLTLSDLEYIQSHGYYKSVKQLARSVISARSQNTKDDVQVAEEKQKPKTKKQAKQPKQAKPVEKLEQ